MIVTEADPLGQVEQEAGLLVTLNEDAVGCVIIVVFDEVQPFASVIITI